MFKETYPDKIHVAFYPYTYVRVMAMKGKLYRKQDYDKLMKMHASEIAKYLEEGDYKEDIHLLGKELSGYALVEAAINANFVRRLRKLQLISSKEMNYLIYAHLKKYDVYNIKTLLRAKTAGQSKEAVSDLLLPLGLLRKKVLLSFFDQDSIEDILKKAGFMEREYRSAISYYKKEKSLLEVENFLDKEYYIFLFKFIQRLSGEYSLFRGFLELQIDVLNVQLLLRLKRTNMEYDRLCSFFFDGGDIFSQATLRRLAKLDFEGMLEGLKKTKIKNIVKEHTDALAKKDLTRFEAALDVWLLRQSTLLLHQFPLSVDTLLGYMFAKEIEVKNLSTLIKGKQLGLNEEFLSKQLVIE